MSEEVKNTRQFTARVYKDEERTEFDEHEFVVSQPSLDDHNEATKVYNRTFRAALESGAILRASLTDYMQEQNLWSEQKELEYAKLQIDILQRQESLEKGGIKLSEARAVALEMGDLRADLRDLISDRTSLDTNTAEGQADNEKFNCLVSRCVVYKSDGKRFYKDYQDFKGSSDFEVSLKGAKILANMMYGLDDNFEKTLPENEFLIKYNLADENLRLIDRQGRFVTRDGELIENLGLIVDDEGNLQEAEKKDEFSPFIDDDTGDLLDKNGKVVEAEKPKPKRKPRAKKAQSTVEA